MFQDLRCSVSVNFMCTFYTIRYCGFVKWWYHFWLICDGRVFSKSFRSTVNQIESRDPDGFDVLRCTTVYCVVVEHNEVHLESKFIVGRFSFEPPLYFMLMNHVHAGNKIDGFSAFFHVYWTVVQK